MAERLFPNVWSPGQLFAFSGIDGETDWFRPLVGTTLADDVGFLFHLKVPRRLCCEPTSPDVSGARRLEPRVVSGDYVEFFVVPTDPDRGAPFHLRYLFLDRWSVIGETSVQMPPRVRADPDAAGLVVTRGSDVTTHSSRQEHTVLVTREYGEKVVFAFSFSSESVAEATGRAQTALLTNLPGLLQRRLLFYNALPALEGASERRRRTVAKAFSVLKTNVESPQGLIPCRWSTPDRWPHRDMWLWDSCFHSLGYRVFSPRLAAEVLSAVLATERQDGFIAHRVSPAGMSDITQPPLLAWACWKLFRFTSNRALLEGAYPSLVRFIGWVLANRRAAGGLLAWRVGDDPLCRSGESGMDNSPRFDAGVPLLAVDFNAYVVSELNSLVEIALVLKRHGEAATWKQEATRLAEAMNELLWDETDGFYYDRTLEGGCMRLGTSAGLLPLFAGVPDEGRARRLLTHLTDPDAFWTAFPVPSVARSDPHYRLDMWRGPTWLNIDLLVIEGLRRYGFDETADELTARLLDAVEHWYVRLGSIYECYDPDGTVPPPELDRKERLKTGTGIAPVSDYCWSAACYLALVTGTL